MEVTTRFGRDRGSWTDVDIDETLHRHPNEAHQITDLIRGFETNWLANANAGPARHDAAIKACKKCSDRVFGGCRA